MKNQDQHIVIATTFRDFNGSINDEIQHNFLDSLKRQNFKNFTLVVSVFREKNVAAVIGRTGLNALIVTNDIDDDKKFCLTDVLLNGIAHADALQSDAIVWTTCDVIFPENFLNEILMAKTDGAVITSHPHQNPSCLRAVSIGSGFDIIALDKKGISNTALRSSVENYRFYDWGVFEHFLIAASISAGLNALNLYKKAPVVKLENDRIPGKETQNWMHNCWLKNKVVFDLFLKNAGVSNKYENLSYCHMRFIMPGYGFRDLLNWIPDYIAFYISEIKKCFLFRIPKSLKKFIRGIY